MMSTNGEQVMVGDLKYFQATSRDLVLFFANHDEMTFKNMAPKSYSSDGETVTVEFVRGDE